MHFECHFFLIYKTKFSKNGEVHQGAKNQYIAKKSTSRKRGLLGMIPMQYENNPLKIAGGDTFWKKFTNYITE